MFISERRHEHPHKSVFFTHELFHCFCSASAPAFTFSFAALRAMRNDQPEQEKDTAFEFLIKQGTRNYHPDV